MKTKQYKIPAQKCTYGGATFDSKHEVRWVRFLELCGIAWEREPLSFIHPIDSTLSWRPDLRITLPDGRQFLCEIKPDADFFNIDKTNIARLRQHDCLLLTNAPQTITGFCRIFGKLDLSNLFPENFLELWEASLY